jgi:hypothetical protein
MNKSFTAHDPATVAMLCLFLLTPTAAAAAPPARNASSAPAGTSIAWNFAPARDDFKPDALLDLRYLNEKEAGESGFVKVDASGGFVLASGKPVRFWAVNTNVGREKPFVERPLWPRAEPDLAHHARFLAKRGVNMVRLHAHLNPGPSDKRTDFNKAERDWIWRTVAAMKKEGIYVTISPFWATAKIGPSWGIPGVSKEQAALGLLYFDPAMQEGYKAWLKALYAEKNPYTGVPLAQEPAVAIIQLQNEDSLLFWTFNSIQEGPRKRLEQLFGDFLKSKYGSLEKARAAWGEAPAKEDDFKAGGVALDNIWELTQQRSGPKARRLDDMTEFLARTMHNFNRDMGKYLRDELGCKQLINAGNWQTADMVKLNDCERWSYTANEVDAVNRYVNGLHVGNSSGWAIIKGDQFTAPSVLLEPRKLPIALKQTKGRPMLVTESSWVMPMPYAGEGPLLVAAYQSLTGVAGYYWFATSTDEWTQPQSANGYMPSQGKWIFANPDMLGGFPAAAMLYRLGYVKRGEAAVHEERPLEDIFQRRNPVIAEGAAFDPNRNSGNMSADSPVKTGVNPLAFLVGPVEVVYGGSARNTRVVDLKKYIDEQAKQVRSITGEITLDYGKGYCLVDAPKAQGVTAFFRNQKAFKTQDVQIACENDYGAVLVVSMDDRPIGQSSKVLVQFTTQCRPAGWRDKPVTIQVKEGKFEGFEVLDFGKAPWQVAGARLTLEIANPNLSKATALDVSGNPAGGVSLTRSGQQVRLTFPDSALYVVLQ